MSPIARISTDIFSALTVAGGVVSVLLLVALIYKKVCGGDDSLRGFIGFFGRNAILFSFIVTLGGIFGSLFYSEIVGFAPCALCWWQRVFLYPQAVIFGLALWKQYEGADIYGIYLSAIGGLIALINAYLQFGGVSFIPCPAIGPSCSQRYFLEFGYVTIPTMALTAFAAIIVLMLAKRSARI